VFGTGVRFSLGRLLVVLDVNDSQGSTDGGLRDQAVAAVKRKHAFKQMLASYVIVNAFLIVIWAVSGAGYF
jgi:hypothetical protein